MTQLNSRVYPLNYKTMELAKRQEVVQTLKLKFSPTQIMLEEGNF